MNKQKKAKKLLKHDKTIIYKNWIYHPHVALSVKEFESAGFGNILDKYRGDKTHTKSQMSKSILKKIEKIHEVKDNIFHEDYQATPILSSERDQNLAGKAIFIYHRCYINRNSLEMVWVRNYLVDMFNITSINYKYNSDKSLQIAVVTGKSIITSAFMTKDIFELFDKSLKRY